MTLPLLPLILSNAANPWTPEVESEALDRDFYAVRGHVLDRDGHACRFCGFRDTGRYMQVHHLDGNHACNEPSNLVAACLHCHAVHHLGLWGSAHGGASVAWLPEFTQAEVSALSRAILVARHGLGFAIPEADGIEGATRACIEMEDAASVLEAALDGRADAARHRLGSSDPSSLALALSAMTDGQYADRDRLLDGYRLVLPNRIARGARRADDTAEVVGGWLRQGGAFEAMAPHTWRRLVA